MMATQRELRQACEAGLRRFRDYANPVIAFDPEMVARQMYPPKTRTRQRELLSPDSGCAFRIFNGCLQIRRPHREWENTFSLVDTRTLIDLFGNPIEIVEDEE